MLHNGVVSGRHGQHLAPGATKPIWRPSNRVRPRLPNPWIADSLDIEPPALMLSAPGAEVLSIGLGSAFGGSAHAHAHC